MQHLRTQQPASVLELGPGQRKYDFDTTQLSNQNDGCAVQVSERLLQHTVVATSYELGFPFMAGSGLSVSWRMPSTDLPYCAHVEESFVIGGGWLDGGIALQPHIVLTRSYCLSASDEWSSKFRFIPHDRVYADFAGTTSGW
eukprot:SAG31_NODE_9326_length_1297_cov_1.329716_2_plen_142_part_00